MNKEKRKEINRLYRLKNKEKIKQAIKNHYLLNKEYYKQYQIEYRKKPKVKKFIKEYNNSKKIKEYRKLYNKKPERIEKVRIYKLLNADKIKEQSRIYRLKNKHKIKQYQLNNLHLNRAAYTRRKAAKLKATPKFANLNKIKEIYKNCPKGYHVDHIIPLRGKTVCGLHVEWNLQYLTPSENTSKSNKLINNYL